MKKEHEHKEHEHKAMKEMHMHHKKMAAHHKKELKHHEAGMKVHGEKSKKKVLKHDDEKQGKTLVKKMVKASCLK